MSSSPSKPTSSDPLRPADHIDSDGVISQPALGFVGWMRWAWRQLTSMRTAIVLLLLMALAAIPGSIFPQRSADPNGVVQYQQNDPQLFEVLDWLSLFDVYSSPWFSAIYILLFVSLIGCIIPRTKHHAKALRTRPPRTPARLARLEDHREDLFQAPGDPAADAAEAIDLAEKQLKASGYRVERYDGKGAFSVSAERGYMRETGNLLFHISLVGVLIAVGIGGGVTYNGQTVIREGETFVNSLLSYNSMSKGRFVSDDALTPYSMTLDSFDVTYRDTGMAGDFAAHLSVKRPGEEPTQETIRVNHPLGYEGDRIFLMGNGYAPTITVRNADGEIVFTDDVPFLPQDDFMTSTGVVKITDGLDEQLGLQGFFYPTVAQLDSGALTSQFPDLLAPVLTLDVYQGDLGIDDGTPRNVYTLNVEDMVKLTGRNSEFGIESIQLMPGETADLPNGIGTISFDAKDPQAAEAGDYSHSVTRYVSLSFHHDPTTTYVLLFALLALAGLGMALFVPRRRLWVKATVDGEHVKLEYAGLARGEDPQLAAVVEQLADKHQTTLTSSKVN